MFSFPISWPSSRALRRAFSLDSWLAHLRSWHHSERSHSTDAHFKDFKYSIATKFTSEPYAASKKLVVNFPSPNVQWDLEYDSDSESDSESEDSYYASSRCQSPTNEKDEGHRIEIAFNACSDRSTTKQLANPRYGQQLLLSQYSQQELVLLEFLTHSSDCKGDDIDYILHQYLPGFSKGCRCDPEDHDGENLCEICQLTEAYLDYSFERCQNPAAWSM